MKIHGSTGKISRTLQFQAVMGVIDVILASSELIKPLMSPAHFVLLFLAVSIAGKLINVYLRSITTSGLT